MILILNATWEYINLYDDEFIKILSDITEKTSSHKQLQDIIIIKAQRSAVEYTETHNDNEITTDSSDSDSVREVFNKDRRVTLEVIIHLRI